MNYIGFYFFNTFKKTPQLLKNIYVKNKSIINKPDIKRTVKIAKKLIRGQGRILVRKSGTESKIRVMGESENEKLFFLDNVETIKFYNGNINEIVVIKKK